MILDNGYMKETYLYLYTVSGSYSLIANYRQFKPYTCPIRGGCVAFKSVGDKKHKENNYKSDINFYACRKMCHCANEWTDKEDASTDNIATALIEG